MAINLPANEQLQSGPGPFWLDSRFSTLAAFRTFFGIPNDGLYNHPVVGSNGSYKNVPTSEIPLNAAFLTGIMWKYRGQRVNIASGTYPMAHVQGTTPKCMPVVFLPESTTTTLGGSDGELGPMLFGEHYRNVVFDFSAIGQAASHGFLGPVSGLTEAGQAACIDILSNATGNRGSKQGIVSELHLEGFRLIGPRADVAAGGLDDTRWISGIRATVESAVLRGLRLVGMPDTGVYLARARYEATGLSLTTDDRGCFIFLERVLVNSTNRIGICLGARYLNVPPTRVALTPGPYIGAPSNDYGPKNDAAALEGFEADHVVTHFCDVQGDGAPAIGCQVWASGWIDQASLFGAAEVGVRILGLRGGYPTVASLHGTRCEKGPTVAAISLWGRVDVDWFAGQIAPGGYSTPLTTVSAITSATAMLTTAANLTGSLQAGATVAISSPRPTSGDPPIKVVGVTDLTHVVLNVTASTVTLARAINGVLANSILRRVDGIESAVVRLERDPDLNGYTAPKQGSARLRLHGGNVDAQDKRYAVYVQPERVPITGTMATVRGSDIATVTNPSGYALGDILNIGGIRGPRRVEALNAGAADKIRLDIAADQDGPAVQVRKRTANTHQAFIRLGGGVGASPDPYVADSQVIYGTFASLISQQQVFIDVDNQVRQVPGGLARPFEYFDSPEAVGPRLAIRYSGALTWGNGTDEDGDTRLERAGPNLLQLADGDSLRLQGQFDAGTLRVGALRLWRDSVGSLRAKNVLVVPADDPTSEADGERVATASRLGFTSNTALDLKQATTIELFSGVGPVASFTNGPEFVPITLVFAVPTTTSVTILASAAKLSDGLAFVGETEDTLTLVRSGTAYYEVGRSRATSRLTVATAPATLDLRSDRTVEITGGGPVTAFANGALNVPTTLLFSQPSGTVTVATTAAKLLGGEAFIAEKDDTLTLVRTGAATYAEVARTRGAIKRTVTATATLDLGRTPVVEVASTAAVTVTAFTGGLENVPITLLFKPGTFIVTIASLVGKLANATSFAGGNNDVLTILRSGGTYYEVSRSKNA